MFDLIRHERELRCWTRAELARRAGLNASTVTLIESGRFLPYRVQIEKIGRAFEWDKAQVERLVSQSHPSKLLPRIGSPLAAGADSLA